MENSIVDAWLEIAQTSESEKRELYEFVDSVLAKVPTLRLDSTERDPYEIKQELRERLKFDTRSSCWKPQDILAQKAPDCQGASMLAYACFDRSKTPARFITIENPHGMLRLHEGDSATLDRYANGECEKKLDFESGRHVGLLVGAKKDKYLDVLVPMDFGSESEKQYFLGLDFAGHKGLGDHVTYPTDKDMLTELCVSAASTLHREGHTRESYDAISNGLRTSPDHLPAWLHLAQEADKLATKRKPGIIRRIKQLDKGDSMMAALCLAATARTKEEQKMYIGRAHSIYPTEARVLVINARHGETPRRDLDAARHMFASSEGLKPEQFYGLVTAIADWDKFYTPKELDESMDKLKSGKRTLEYWAARAKIAARRKDYERAGKAYSEAFECIDRESRFVDQTFLLKHARKAAERAGDASMLARIGEREKDFYAKQGELRRYFDKVTSRILK